MPANLPVGRRILFGPLGHAVLGAMPAGAPQMKRRPESVQPPPSTIRIASGYRRCSSTRIRADSVSTVSSSSSGTAACRTIGPLSSSEVTRWTVAPDDAVLERLTLRLEPRKGRQQRRMDIQDPVTERRRSAARRPDACSPPGKPDSTRRDASRSATAHVVGVAAGMLAGLTSIASMPAVRARPARRRRRGRRSPPQSPHRAGRARWRR